MTSRSLPRLLLAGLVAVLAVLAAWNWRPRAVDGYDSEGRPLAGGRVLTRPLVGERPRNVILVSVDTLRADILGFGAQARPTSPHLDRLSRSAVVFSDCISSAPHTDPAHATMFTGLYPRGHGVYDHTRRLPDQVTTLAEILAAQGYQTTALTNSPKFHRSLGLDQGFQTYEVVAPYETEPWLTRVLSFLEKRPAEPTFLFLHVLDPHAPYRPPSPQREAFHPRYSGPFQGDLGRMKTRTGGARAAAYMHIEVVRAWYASEVLEIDAALGQIVGRLETLGLLEDSVLILLSDHGEEMLDHGGMEHSHTVFDELIRVPLLIRAPGWPGGRVVPVQVRTVDLLPTVLSLVGLPQPSGLPGVPLSPELKSETGPAVSQRAWDWEVSWRHRGEKLRYDLKNHKVLGYFDLRRDPAERDSRVKHDFQRVEELAAELERWAAETHSHTASEAALDAATREAIEALGYVGE